MRTFSEEAYDRLTLPEICQLENITLIYRPGQEAMYIKLGVDHVIYLDTIGNPDEQRRDFYRCLRQAFKVRLA